MFKESTKTKAYLWTIVLVTLASIGCLAGCIVGAGLAFGYVAFGGFIFSTAYSQLGVFKDVNAQINEQDALAKSIIKQGERSKSIANAEKRKMQELEEGEENELNRYTEENIKKYLVSYKAKKENYRVLIDSSEKYKISKCPAYVWSDKNYMFLLLMEKKTRIVTVPRKETGVLRYEKGVIITDMEEYKKVKDSMFLGSLFRELYPKYYKKTVNGLTTFMKNLFIIGEDIRITTCSARGIIKATGCRLELTDKQIDRKRFGGYFEDIYKENLLLKEGAYTQDEYNARIRELLSALAEHEEKQEVFQKIIYQLVQYNMISREYAEFYMEYRGKNTEKRKG